MVVPDVCANFESMMCWGVRGVPLPLGAVRTNRRSLVELDKLTDLIACCATRPAAFWWGFFATDGEDVLTAELLTRVGALDPGSGGAALCGSLQVDIGQCTAARLVIASVAGRGPEANRQRVSRRASNMGRKWECGVTGLTCYAVYAQFGGGLLPCAGLAAGRASV
ncbi:hypothetical protein [Microvirgula aerodenitrificans]|uniref:hypothetical protein n=1 Tax=Microvirgula aerodenitrificans TaxID=57480 RepID=UPI00248E298D|nr:hypothetical protein [Microvirgula aerodenitrificans]